MLCNTMPDMDTTAERLIDLARSIRDQLLNKTRAEKLDGNLLLT